MDYGIYRVNMDGRWSLKDLYDFPHAYLQVYAFVHAFDSELPSRDADRINYALENYPWAGGYSVVNIYSVLQSQMGPLSKPIVKEIRYASPGWMDLLLHIHPAVKIAGAVAAVSASAAGTVKAYASIQECLYKIRARAKQAKVERIQLTIQEIQALRELNEELAKAIEFTSVRELEERTGNVETTAKLLSAHFRRLKALAGYVKAEKASFPRTPLPVSESALSD